RTQTMLGNVYANIQLAKGLSLRTTLGTNIINQRNDYYGGKELQYISASANGVAEVRNNQYTSWQFENYLTYVKDFDIHSITAMAGLSWQHIDRFENMARTQNFGDDYFKFYNLGSGASPQAPTSFGNAYGLNSYFGRINYSLNN